MGRLTNLSFSLMWLVLLSTSLVHATPQPKKDFSISFVSVQHECTAKKTTFNYNLTQESTNCASDFVVLFCLDSSWTNSNNLLAYSIPPQCNRNTVAVTPKGLSFACHLSDTEKRNGWKGQVSFTLRGLINGSNKGAAWIGPLFDLDEFTLIGPSDCHDCDHATIDTVNCDDGNKCTNDTCRTVNGYQVECVRTPKCDDYNNCTTDQCNPSNGQCTYTSIDCNDYNVCTNDWCDSATGQCRHSDVADGTNCTSDGNLCNGQEQCWHGQCAPGVPLHCDDYNECTLDVCEPSRGCQYYPQSGSSCSDGDICTGTAEFPDVCQSGVCVAGESVDCDDYNPCTRDVCEPTGCKHYNEPSSTPCDDGKNCTGTLEYPDHCYDGYCVAGATVYCNDSNECTNDVCEEGKGCQYYPQSGTTCSDGDICTGTAEFPDVCQAGVCVSGQSIDCDDYNPCTRDVCELTGCKHYYEPNTTPCDDGKNCTGTLEYPDHCYDGYCVAGGPAYCDDYNECTRDVCEEPYGCKFYPLSGNPCDDGNDCTGTVLYPDYCHNGYCVAGETIHCDDYNPCTRDVCENEECKHYPLSGVPCDDGKDCTGTLEYPDHCYDGYCVAGAEVYCDDYNECTRDICEEGKGCVYYPLSGTHCSDGSGCTGTELHPDYCHDGYCVPGEYIHCDDYNPCTRDVCEGYECKHYPLSGVPCDDGDWCTGTEEYPDYCHDGYCVGGYEQTCDDYNECTIDVCEEGEGCKHYPLTGTYCSDYDSCTGTEEYPDHCYEGYCVPGHTVYCDDCNPCTEDFCELDGCHHYPLSNTPCDDGDCCTGTKENPDHCYEGYCVAGADVYCDDYNQCTRDACEQGKGCVFYPLTGTHCEDGDSCTGTYEYPDYCHDGYCHSGEQIDCDDYNPCTRDVCEHEGCKHYPLSGTLCDDGKWCTGTEEYPDHCYEGYCVPGAEVNCDDYNECTNEYCEEGYGCKYYPLSGTPCSDDNNCTGTCDHPDHCYEGYCVPGQEIYCDDYNPCTLDVCENYECKHYPLSYDTPCDDGKQCTGTEEYPDHCYDGYCVGGAPVYCDDYNECTRDYCEEGKGCQYYPLSGTPCNDGDSCTGTYAHPDYCHEGYCVAGQKIHCDDYNPCTRDVCEGYECKHYPLSHTPCDDGKQCTGTEEYPDHCYDGYCVAGAPVYCDDYNQCTKDVCEEGVGCQSYPLSGIWCNDGDNCTGTYGHPDYCHIGYCHPGEQIHCDDYNPCTLDVCEEDGCHHYPLSFTPCDDEKNCTGTEEYPDYCYEGYCVAGAPVYCDDYNECTRDVCEEGRGCEYYPLSGTLCSDSSECTGTLEYPDYCHDGYCVPGPENYCNDYNPCTVDYCDYTHGQCKHHWAEDGIDCSCDDDLCDGVETCYHGYCTEGEPLYCNDYNECTIDVCDKYEGCKYYPQSGTICDDGNACTGTCDNPDKCHEGYCAPGPCVDCDDHNECTREYCIPSVGCVYEEEPEGSECSDYNACTGTEEYPDYCHYGHCKSGAEVDCDDYNPCTIDSCHDEYGCSHYRLPDGNPCEGNGCQGCGECWDGYCVFEHPHYCNDYNPCTSDWCDPETGECHFDWLPNGYNCSDDNICNGEETCWDGYCKSGYELDCDDYDPCTEDICEQWKGCVHYPLTGNPCDDGDFCTGTCHDPDVCCDGHCKPGPENHCNDYNPCTTDWCNSETESCEHSWLPNGSDCSTDGDVCNGIETCHYGYCVPGTPLHCNDYNECTLDFCDRYEGCKHLHLTGTPCEDGDHCTGTEEYPDLCHAGYCKPGAPKHCDDYNECTVEYCLHGVGCVYENVLPGTACCDGNLCTGTHEHPDHCVYGECVGGAEAECGDGNPCTVDYCDPENGCVHEPLPDGHSCGGCPCQGLGWCHYGECQFDPPLDCDDGNPCTRDVCEEGKGCQHYPLSGGPCDDGNECTGTEQYPDYCHAGYCKPGAEIYCDDYNVCTRDVCEPERGCQYYPQNGIPCFDGDYCTGSEDYPDYCLDGHCKSGPSKSCDDYNPCTQDWCNSDYGGTCHHEEKHCDDYNLCTTDYCDSQTGECVNRAKDCDDYLECSLDSCNPQTGECEHDKSYCPIDCSLPYNNGLPCDDRNPCTIADVCTGGYCRGIEDTCQEETVLPIVSGPNNIPVGIVVVHTSNSSIQFSITASSDYKFTQLQLFVGKVCGPGENVNCLDRSKVLIPDSFPFQAHFDEAVATYTWTLTLEMLHLYCRQEGVVFSLHANVVCETSHYPANLSAWAKGKIPTPPIGFIEPLQICCCAKSGSCQTYSALSVRGRQDSNSPTFNKRGTGHTELAQVLESYFALPAGSVSVLSVTNPSETNNNEENNTQYVEYEALAVMLETYGASATSVTLPDGFKNGWAVESVSDAVKPASSTVSLDEKNNLPLRHMRNFIPPAGAINVGEELLAGQEIPTGANTSGVFRSMTFSVAGAFVVLVFTAILARIR